MTAMPVRPTMLMIGPFPPPVHGASLVTARLAERLGPHMAIATRDISPGNAQGLAYHVVRACRVLAAAGAILASPRGASVYLSAAGGSGLVYTAFLACVARLASRRIVVHHHSFAYINRRSGLMALVATITGREAMHLTLCPSMAARLTALYPQAGKTVTLSNAFLFEPAAERFGHDDAAPLRLGHLSNLSREKGLYDALAVQERLQREGIAAELLLAGPTSNGEDAKQVASAVSLSGGRIRHLGALYDAAKDGYFASIDAFLFPSRYVNEAEPLVLFEALSQGVPVIAYDRGCISEQLGEEGGLVVATDASFAEAAVPLIAEWAADRGCLRQAQLAARQRMSSLTNVATDQFGDLLSFLGVNGARTNTGNPA